MESMKFREDNSHQLRKELKQESKAVYGLVKSDFVHGPQCRDLYNGTASTFYPLGEDMYEQLLEDLYRKEKKIYLHRVFHYWWGLMWNSILEILEQKVKEGAEVKLFMMISAVWRLWLGTIPNAWERWGLSAHKFNKVIPV